jgi:MFS family permease
MNLVQPRQTRSFVALLSSVFCSAAAVALLTTVLGKQVFDLTGSSLDLGLLGLAEFAPAALLVFVTGPLADRVDRRKLAAGGLVLQAVSIAVLAWYAGHEADFYGVPYASGSVLLIVGAATLVVAGLWWKVFPALRNVDRVSVAVEPAPGPT